MEEGGEFLCIGLSVGAVGCVGWLFWHRNVPEFVVCSASFDEWLLVVGHGDVIGFRDGDFFVSEHSCAVVVTCLSH